MWISHRHADADESTFWAQLDISTRIHRIQVPALHISGWYDIYLEGSVAGYVALRQGAGTAFARDHQYLLAGPWVHIPWSDRIGDQCLGPAANLDTDALLLRWFNHWLKDSGEFAAEPRVSHFTLGEDEWRSADEWPTEAPLTLYLHSNGNANSAKGDGWLSAVPPHPSEPCDLFVYDPEVPVLSPGGPQSLSGPFDQIAMEMGNNLLIYSTAPVTAPTPLFGQPRVTLYAATSAAHADLTAKLVRLTVSGRAELLCLGIARSSWLFQGLTYTADIIHCWDFTLKPTSVVLAPGDSLRLEIASSAFPLYDRNPFTEVLPSQAHPWTWQRSTPHRRASVRASSSLHRSL